MGWRDLNSGYPFILIAIFIWATQAFVTKIMVTSIGFFSVYLFASVLSGIAALICYFILNHGKMNLGLAKNIKKIVLISIFLGLTNFLLFASFGLLSATNVIVLLYIYPIFMSILSSIVMKKGLTGREIVGLALGFIGIFIFATNGNPLSFHIDNPFANLMVLVAAFSWAIYLIVQKKYHMEEFSSNGIAYLLSAVYTLPLIILAPSLLPNGIVFPNQNILLLILYFSVVTFVLGNVIYIKGLKKTKTVNTALLSYLTPFIAVILNYMVLGEQISWYDIIPIVFIFIGYFILDRAKSKPEINA